MIVVSLHGRLARDPELRQTPTGKSVVSFAVAVKRRGKDSETDFFDCVAWERTAKLVSDYFAKGQEIALSGHLQTRSYEDKQGNRRKVVEIIASDIDFCGSRSDNPQKRSDEHSINDDMIELGDTEDYPF